MRRSEPGTALLVAGLALAAAAAANEDTERSFLVSSEPSGARVWSITGELGTTPLRVGERSIYPNRFPQDRVDEYGKLFVSRPGCTTVTHAVAIDEVAEGVRLTLDCRPGVARVAVENLGPPGPEESAVPTAPSAVERRLRQLRLLDELVEDGIISAEEERSIRRRLLAR